MRQKWESLSQWWRKVKASSAILPWALSPTDLVRSVQPERSKSQCWSARRAIFCKAMRLRILTSSATFAEKTSEKDRWSIAAGPAISTHALNASLCIILLIKATAIEEILSKTTRHYLWRCHKLSSKELRCLQKNLSILQRLHLPLMRLRRLPRVRQMIKTTLLMKSFFS